MTKEKGLKIDDGHVGVEDPVDVGVDLGHGLKICFIFAKLRLTTPHCG